MNQDALAVAKLRLEEMLTFFGINTTVKISEDGERAVLQIDTPQNSLLIGKGGENMQALQHLINMMVRNTTTEPVYLTVDVGDYRKARAERLAVKAKDYAQQVIDTGEELRLKPMSPADRRVVHMALAEHPEVETESVGEGRGRRLVVRKRSQESES
jgi:spoIIIJ-associated protein